MRALRGAARVATKKPSAKDEADQSRSAELASVVMAHGAFCAGWTFDKFREPFEAAGHQVTALDLPGHAPGTSVSGRSMTDYARYVAEVCASQEAAPVLIGHSLGGLVAQMAAMRTPLAGLVLLAPSPAWGVAGSSLEELAQSLSLYALGPYWTGAVDPDYLAAKLYSLDRLPGAERRTIFARMTAESGLALWQTLSWWHDPFMATSVNPNHIKAPALVIAGGRDAIHPPVTVRQTAERLRARFVTMHDMSHWLPGEPGWEDVAQTCLTWIAEATARTAA